MTGVEVAGLLLGTFPLLISGLEHYNETRNVIGQWRNIKQQYKKCKRAIELHQVLYESNLQKFLLPIIVSYEEIEELVSAPLGSRWKDPELEETLQSRLPPRAYNVYLETITEMNGVMRDLQKELGLDKVHFQTEIAEAQSSGTCSAAGAGTRAMTEYQKQRLKFAFGEPNRDRLFSKINQLNDELEKVLKTSDEIAAARRLSPADRVSGTPRWLLQFWQHANAVYTSLQQSWDCECRARHLSKLRLEHRTSPELDFQVLLNYAESRRGGDSASWAWQSTCISVRRAQSHVAAVLVVPQSGKAHTPTHSTPDSIRPALRVFGKSRKGTKVATFPCVTVCAVVWVIANIHRSPGTPVIPNSGAMSGPSSVSASPSGNVQSPAKNSKDADREITNLCTEIAGWQLGASSCGCLKDRSSTTATKYVVHQIQPPYSATDERSTKTLGDLLRDGCLDRGQRLGIALTAASSHLQLHSSAWLKGVWSKDNIVFFPRSGASLPFRVDQPYLSQELLDGNTAAAPGQVDQTFATLAILLLELCFGVPIEESDVYQKYLSPDGQPNPVLNIAAAWDWSSGDKVVGEAGVGYADAVDWCLSNRKVSASDQGWREELYTRVVQPLQKCYEDFRRP
ncbi:hypothetical protein LTR50_006108 [Elasticomyces elasticus]|nr:hypothetical protein LTR50_006108 [Elasticomyces elasticus]